MEGVVQDDITKKEEFCVFQIILLESENVVCSG